MRLAQVTSGTSPKNIESEWKLNVIVVKLQMLV